MSDKLKAAIAEVHRVTPTNQPWAGDDLQPEKPADEIAPIDHAIATILNAVASGDLITREAAEARAGAWPFQSRVHDWIIACFGAEIGADRIERNHRFLEEALELVQSTGCTQSEAHQLVDYVFGRPVGEPFQEVGGVMNTLAALCTANGIDMADAGEVELARVWTQVEKIRAKQAAKPKHSPLPESAPDATAALERAREVKPLVWFEVEKSRSGGKYTADGYTIRYIEGLWLLDFAGQSRQIWKFPTLESAKAAAQVDYAARITAALQPLGGDA